MTSAALTSRRWEPSDTAFLVLLAAGHLFLGWRTVATPAHEQPIEFLPGEVFSALFTLAGLAVLIFAVDRCRWWRAVSGALVVAAATARAVALLIAGYWDGLIPTSRAQVGFVAWMLGATLATYVWTRALPRGR